MAARRRDVVAERTWFVRGDDGRHRPVHITFERPIKQPTGEWGCTYRIDGPLELDGAVASKPIFGIDSVQALVLAIRFVDDVLLHSRAFAEGRFAWGDGGEPLQSGDLTANFLGMVPKAQGVRVAEIVRTVELQLAWSLPCRLRIDVLRTELAPPAFYWTRVWRSDVYRMRPFAQRRGRAREADETVLVEDAMFSECPVAEATPEAALDETIKRIKWQLFSSVAPAEASRTARAKSRRSKSTRRR